jgi:predicted membrane protein
MKWFKTFMLYAYSMVIALLFYFHNAIFTWDKELFLSQIDNFSIVKVYLLALGILILLVIGYKLLDDLFL